MRYILGAAQPATTGPVEIATLAIAAFAAFAVVVSAIIAAWLTRRTEHKRWRRNELLTIVADMLATSANNSESIKTEADQRRVVLDSGESHGDWVVTAKTKGDAEREVIEANVLHLAVLHQRIYLVGTPAMIQDANRLHQVHFDYLGTWGTGPPNSAQVATNTISDAMRAEIQLAKDTRAFLGIEAPPQRISPVGNERR